MGFNSGFKGLKRRIVTSGNLYSSVASPHSGQQASVLCELTEAWSGVYFFFFYNAGSNFPSLYYMFCV